MPTFRKLRPQSPWLAVSVSAQDWNDADPAMLRALYTQTLLVRTFEETVLELAAQGLIHGPAHSSIGQDGAAVASVMALRPTDHINGSHRGHHQFLAKAFGHVCPEGINPSDPVPPPVREVLVRALAEICGLAHGFCRGRGGSMHLQWMDAGAMGTNAIVGGAVPAAAGFAWASKQAGTDGVAVTYFGDGAINIGSVLETMNLAAAWSLPVCFFIENNQYAVSTQVAEATAEPRLSARGLAFKIASWRVDGMDPLAVHAAMSEAVEHMRRGDGPTIVEADVYRYFHQNGPFAGSAFGYRSKEEEREWKDRDPLAKVAHELRRRRLLSDEDAAACVEEVKKEMASVAGELLEEDPEGKPGASRIRVELWPDPAFVDVGVRSDLTEFADARFEYPDNFCGETVEKKFVDVVADVMDRRMATDERVVVMGEDVHRLKGGVNGATRGLADHHPGRVLGTPISENAFAGLAGGLALDGRYQPVVEFMYPDFLWVAADQVFNQIGKARHMFGGDHAVPLVLRTKVAIGTGYGSQHSMDPAGIFATSPGWRIVAPSTPFEYVGLMNSALRCHDPVLVLEHMDLYGTTGPVPAADLDFCLPVGTAALKRTGSQLTVITYLAMTHVVLDALQDESMPDADVIDLRWLDRASLDWELVGQSVRKTGRVLIAEQGALGTGYGAWLADEIQRRYFDWLDEPVHRVHGGEASPSISRVLERAAYPGPSEVRVAIIEASGAGDADSAQAAEVRRG